MVARGLIALAPLTRGKTVFQLDFRKSIEAVDCFGQNCIARLRTGEPLLRMARQLLDHYGGRPAGGKLVSSFEADFIRNPNTYIYKACLERLRKFLELAVAFTRIPGVVYKFDYHWDLSWFCAEDNGLVQNYPTFSEISSSVWRCKFATEIANCRVKWEKELLQQEFMAQENMTTAEMISMNDVDVKKCIAEIDRVQRDHFVENKAHYAECRKELTDPDELLSTVFVVQNANDDNKQVVVVCENLILPTTINILMTYANGLLMC